LNSVSNASRTSALFLASFVWFIALLLIHRDRASERWVNHKDAS
jgi:hypothetical protein